MCCIFICLSRKSLIYFLILSWHNFLFSSELFCFYEFITSLLFLPLFISNFIPLWSDRYYFNALVFVDNCFVSKFPIQEWVVSFGLTGQRGLIEFFPKHYRLLPTLLVTLHNLMVTFYCWRYIIEHGEIRLVLNLLFHYCCLVYKVLEVTFHVLEEKSNHQTAVSFAS